MNNSERTTTIFSVTQATLQEMCREAFGAKAKPTNISPLYHGAVNATYSFTVNSERFILRIYVRDPSACRRETALLSLLPDAVLHPVPVYSCPTAAPHPYTIFRFAEGKPLLYFTDASLSKELSTILGRTLAHIHSVRFSSAGLFGEGLTIAQSFHEGSSPYYDYICQQLVLGSLAWERMGAGLANKILAFVKEHRHLFPVIGKEAVLVHSDFKPVNLLWQPGGSFTVLDWEFAHAGDRLMDLGILLRHCDQFPFTTNIFASAYQAAGGVLAADWIARARTTDFINSVQLLNHPTERPHLHKKLIASCLQTMSSVDE